MSSLRFYKKVVWFSLCEQWSCSIGALSNYLLYPIIVWIFHKVWLSLNNGVSSLGDTGLFLYIGLSEILFLSSLISPSKDRVTSDFSLSFVRPRSWVSFSFVDLYTKTLVKRLGLLFLFLLIEPTGNRLNVAMNFAFFLPLLTFIDTFYSLLFVSLEIRTYALRDFKRLFGKVFLVFGGVITPFCDISDRWKEFFLATPFSDLIFQPCYYSITGYFYDMSFSIWSLRISTQLIVISSAALVVYHKNRSHYHNFGG